MAPKQRRDKPDEDEPELKRSADLFLADLGQRIQQGQELNDRRIGGSSESLYSELFDDFRSWDEYNLTLLRRSFTTAAIADGYESHASRSPSAMCDVSIHKKIEWLQDDIGRQLRKLSSIASQVGDGLYGTGPSEGAVQASSDIRTFGQRIFIVHGHKDALKLEVADFLKKATGTDPIILHLQANSGRTLIEKVERYGSDAGFAVVLLTCDDLGRALEGTESPRARQNVVFELGYFIGLLGRGRVAALLEDGVEKPSDIDGLVYTPLSGNWKLGLARELRAAEIEVDLNKVE